MILLINPGYYRFQLLEQDYVPLSLLAVGSKIASTGEEVYLKNMEVFTGGQYEGYTSRREHFDDYQKALQDESHPAWVELNALLDEYKPDTIGISVLNVKYQSALRIIEIARRRKIKVIVGGTHPTIEPDKYPWWVNVWPGEYESENKRVQNLDDLPLPEYDILLDKYSPNGYGHLMSSRGCPYRCLHGDTIIDTTDGYFKIKDLVGKTPLVLTRNKTTQKPEYAKAATVAKTRTDAKLVRVLFDNKEYIDCTPDHKFITFKNGNQNSITTEKETEAQYLKKGESVRAIHYEKTRQGYIDIVWGRNKRQKQHRLMVETIENKTLSGFDLVHHKDKSKTNNVSSNLILTDYKRHLLYHPEIAKRMRENNPGKNTTSEQHRLNSIGKKRTLEQRIRYRESKLGNKNPRYSDGLSRHKSRIKELEINHKIISVTPIEGVSDTYCMEVPGHDWFYANGVLVHNCKFCASKTIWKNKVTFKSPSRMVEEMKLVNDKFGTDIFTFWDETFTCNRARLIEFCYRFKASGIKAGWRCDTRADSISDGMIQMMKAAGCVSVSMGVEVGDDAALREIGKDETCATIQRAADILNSNDMQWKAYSIIGFPNDTEERIVHSTDFIKGLKPNRITMNVFTPYKGTPLYDTCDKLGLINETYSESLFSHQSPHNYFCPKIPKARFTELRNQIALDIDLYNSEALRTWI